MFEVLEAGLQTTVQDVGRRGYLASGIPPSGAQDQFSFRVANLLVKNPIGGRFLCQGDPGTTALEITLFGLHLRALSPAVVAVTGADLDCTLNDEPLPQWQTVAVAPGDVISFRGSRKGCRAYLAVAGGFEADTFLGSRSTNVRAGVGGLGGRALKKGDVLKTGQPSASPESLLGRRFRPDLIPPLTSPWTVRVVLEPQSHLFTDESIETFLSYPWNLSVTSDRMGFRFIGPPLQFKPRPEYLIKQAGSDPSNIVDDPIPVGGIQVPSGLEPIVMGVDGPSLGGYAKIATVISVDLDRIGQMRPGEEVTFQAVEVDEAQRLLRSREEMICGDNVVTVAS